MYSAITLAVVEEPPAPPPTPAPSAGTLYARFWKADLPGVVKGLLSF